ncbi:MAG: chalcone isomerase family protein [Bacteriovoracaceae bacterium]
MKRLFFIFLLLPQVLIASEFKLVGKALLEFSIFKIDVYEVSYFKGKDQQEKLVLNYFVDVKREHSIQGWEKGLKHLKDKDLKFNEQFNWIIKNTVDIKKGDIFTIIKENNKVTFLKNSKPIASTQNTILAKLAFEPWIGEKPIDKDIKNQLLKNL